MAQTNLTCPSCGFGFELPPGYTQAYIPCPGCGAHVSRHRASGRAPAAPGPEMRPAPAPWEARPAAPARPRPMPQRAQPQFPAAPQYPAGPQPAAQYPAGPQYPQQYAGQYPPYPGRPYPAQKRSLWWLWLLIPGLIVGVTALSLVPLLVTDDGGADDGGTFSSTTDWPQHYSVKGRYQANFPLEPGETSNQTSTPLGMRTVYTAAVVSRGRTFEVTWFDLGSGPTWKYTYNYPKAVAAIARITNGHVNWQHAANVSGYSGSEAEIGLADGKVSRCRLVRVGNRVYLMQVANASRSDPDIDRFLDSFAVTAA